MNDQCHDCKIRKLCYLEEPKEDWTCDHYEPCEYDEEVATDINVGDKDAISRQAAIEALTKDKKALEHIINGMSGYDVRLDAYVSQRNQVNCDIDTINNLPPAQPAQLGANLAEVGMDCISRQAAIDGKICIQRSNGVEIYDDYAVPVKYLEQLPPAQPAQPEPLQPWEVLAAQAVLSPPEPHWIPVTERLPDISKSVLICDIEGDIYLGYRTKYGDYYPDFWDGRIKNVTAWMPLPGPYKEVTA